MTGTCPVCFAPRVAITKEERLVAHGLPPCSGQGLQPLEAGLGVAPGRPLGPVTKRLLGVGITVFCAVGLAVIYDSIPGGTRVPVVILAVPAVAVAAGIFQAITGMTLFEANETLPRMPGWKRTAIFLTLIAILLGVLAAFIWLTWLR